MLKYLRIAVTALSLTACVLLIALWVRSYTWLDVSNYRIASFWGRLYFNKQFSFIAIPGKPPVTEAAHPHFLGASFLVDDVFVGGSPGGIWIPYWLLVLFCVAFAVLPWRHQLASRFSLRTLLIATTLVAVGLGIVAILN